MCCEPMNPRRRHDNGPDRIFMLPTGFQPPSNYPSNHFQPPSNRLLPTPPHPPPVGSGVPTLRWRYGCETPTGKRSTAARQGKRRPISVFARKPTRRKNCRRDRTATAHPRFLFAYDGSITCAHGALFKRDGSRRLLRSRSAPIGPDRLVICIDGRHCLAVAQLFANRCLAWLI
jgi:hypothetical protein